MSKTEDIEFEIKSALGGGPMTLAALEEGGRFGWLDDRRWLGAAVHNMLRDGQVVTPDCDPGHNHDGACRIAEAGAHDAALNADGDSDDQDDADGM